MKAIATASHAVSAARGVPDGEGLDVDTALSVAELVVRSVKLPVTIDFERGYADDAAGVQANVARLIGTGAVGLNLEDSLDGKTMRSARGLGRASRGRACGRRGGGRADRDQRARRLAQPRRVRRAGDRAGERLPRRRCIGDLHARAADRGAGEAGGRRGGWPRLDDRRAPARCRSRRSRGSASRASASGRMRRRSRWRTCTGRGAPRPRSGRYPEELGFRRRSMTARRPRSGRAARRRSRARRR